MINKVLLGICCFLLVLCLIFGFLWKINNTNYKNVCVQLTDAESKLITLQKENKNLIDFVLKKETEVKQIKSDYEKKLLNKPKDNCGDVKPSDELLKYFRENK